MLIGFIQTIAIGGHNNILETVSALPWYEKLIIPSIGGLIIGPLIYFFGKETKGHGVPEVMEAVALRSGKIRSRVMFLKAFVSAVNIATGGSVGREGPIVQIGSSLGSTFGRWLKVSQDRLKVLVACGAAAGIAATFNAPIAGVMFSVEIILGNYAIITLVPLIMSSVMATIVARWYFGDILAFEIPRYSLGNAWEIGPYILLGIASGVVAVGFIKLLYSLEDFADKIPIKSWLKTPLILFLIGLMLLGFPHVYGVGYDTITQVLKGGMVWYMLLFLVPIKMLATSVTLAAGGSGGIFAPSLFVGAVFGGLFGTLMHFFFPDVVISSGAYAVVGMSAMVAGTTHAPITAFLVIFEMTGDYKLILPLMLCSILASFVASIVKKDSIYTMKLTRRGVDLSRGMEVSIMQATKVRDVMNKNMVVLNESKDFNDLLKEVINSNEAYYFVVDDKGKYQGSFNVHDVKEVLNEKSLAGLVVAKDLVPISLSPSIEMDATLAQCMRKFGVYEMEELPVVEDENSKRLIGKVGRRDIINVYNREILRQGSLGLKFIQGKLSETSPTQSYVDLPDGCEINVIPVTTAIQGHTLQELDIRHNYAVTVVAINRIGERGDREVIIPDSEENLKKGDMLVVIGMTDALKRLKEAFDLPS
jgi:CIC family chloride channel protein